MERPPGRGLSQRAMDAFKPFLVTLSSGAALSREQAREAFDTLLSGEVTPAQAGAFLMGLRVRGETIDEISGAIDALRARLRATGARGLIALRAIEACGLGDLGPLLLTRQEQQYRGWLGAGWPARCLGR